MIEAVDISKRYRDHDVLESFHASIETNSLTVITGESGKGKTTLLNILSLLERPDRGTVTIDAISDPSPKQILNLRRHTISYLFQNYGLIDEYTVEKNLDRKSVV
nr:ATP-binding cassette domain-containing protein [uncultured Acetatifactor sp.]